MVVGRERERRKKVVLGRTRVDGQDQWTMYTYIHTWKITVNTVSLYTNVYKIYLSIIRIEN
jgi:hypothetical protein